MPNSEVGISIQAELNSLEEFFRLKWQGSGLLMTTIYKENDKSWALCVLVLTFLLLNTSKTVTSGPIFMI